MANGTPESTKKLSLNPTVVLGLGGTGRRIVSRLKALARERLREEIPVVRYLVLDTDVSEASRPGAGPADGALDPAEFVALPVEEVDGLLANRDKHPYIFSWFPEGITAKDLKYGANQIRALGRLAFFWNIETIRRAVEGAVKAVGNLRARTAAQGLGYTVPDAIHVFIVSSVCGGTGSGLLVDSAYLARRLAERAEVIGLLVLPSAFAIERQASIEANGYAALKELEHFSLAREFSAQYGAAFSVDVKGSRPFDRAYLLDAWNEKERHLDGTENVFRMAAEILFSKIHLGMYERHRSLVDNVQHRFNARLEERSTAYSSVGHAAFRLPVGRLRCALARRKLAALLAPGPAAPDPAPEALQYLKEQGLNEEATDDLITALRVVDGKPYRPNADAGLAADTPIEELPILAGRFEVAQRTGMKNCLDAMERTAAELRARSLAALAGRLERHLRSGAGVPPARALVLDLKARFAAFADLMNDEIESKFKKWKKNLFVAQKKERLTGLLSGFFAWLNRGRILAAFEEFATEQSRDAAYDVEIASRKHAADLYAALGAELDRLAGRLDALAARFVRLGARAAAEAAGPALLQGPVDPDAQSGAITDIEILADPAGLDRLAGLVRYDEETLRNSLAASAGGTLLALADGEDDAAFDRLLAPVAAAVAAGLDLALPAVLPAVGSAGPQGLFARTVHELLDSAAPFWEYSKVCLPSGYAPDEIVVVALDERLRDEFRRACPETVRPIFAEAADPERIPVFRFKHGLPLFALKRVRNEFRAAYGAVADRRVLHVFPAAAAGPDLVP